MSKKMLQFQALALDLLDLPENKEKQFLGAIVYLDPKTYREDPGQFHRELYPGKVLSCAYSVVQLWELGPEPILEAMGPGSWPFVPLMRGDPPGLLLRTRMKIKAPVRRRGLRSFASSGADSGAPPRRSPNASRGSKISPGSRASCRKRPWRRTSTRS